MARTGAQLLTGFSRFIGDEPLVGGSTTTSAGAGDGTTLVDTTLGRFGDDTIEGWYLRPTGSTNQYAIRRITAFTSSTGTCTVSPAFAAQTATAEAYELHRYDPAAKFTALDEARLRVFPDLCQIIYDDTITADGRSYEWDVPSAVRRGPAFVFLEDFLNVDTPWNFVTDPLGTSTTNWTASNVTASTYSQDENDLVIPKFSDSSCTKLVVASGSTGVYSQPVASQANDVTAANAAGRQMTFAAWVYSRNASVVTLRITDDASTTSSTAHQGLGWELLVVEKEIAHNNATLLTIDFRIDGSAAAQTAFWNRAWFYYGTPSRVRSIYENKKLRFRLRRDDTTQRFTIDGGVMPRRGTQLRLIGRDILSALGTTAASQVTNTMEVDQSTEQVLYAEAAKILFDREGLNASDYPEVAQRIAFAERERMALRRRWSLNLPSGSKLKGPWVNV